MLNNQRLRYFSLNSVIAVAVAIDVSVAIAVCGCCWACPLAQQSLLEVKGQVFKRNGYLKIQPAVTPNVNSKNLIKCGHTGVRGAYLDTPKPVLVKHQSE